MEELTNAIINIENLRHNIREIKKCVSQNTKILMPVKANAYGHGSLICARVAQEMGIDYLSVARVKEAVPLRENGIKLPILLFSLCSPEEVEEALDLNITPFVFDREYIDLFAEACRKKNIKNYPVHLAVDSGMGRIGCYKEESADLALYIENTGVLHLQGMCTHFAVSDATDNDSIDYTRKQFAYFTEAIENVKKAGITPEICHCSNSAATLAYPDMQLDMIRPGIIFYGYYPDQVNREYLNKKGKDILLKPVMTLETRVCSIRHISKGMSIGYGRTWTAQEDTDIAVLPIGYGDGLYRRFAQKGLSVSINGKPYPVVGRICMDQCMVNIGNNSCIKRWDKVIIFGDRENGALQTAQDLADSTSTISYEITTEVGNRITRKVL